MFELLKNNSQMKAIFGSRFLSGKLRSNKNFINEIFAKVNSLIFNILFQQSLTDLHCGTKIIAKEKTGDDLLVLFSSNYYKYNCHSCTGVLSAVLFSNSGAEWGIKNIENFKRNRSWKSCQGRNI